MEKWSRTPIYYTTVPDFLEAQVEDRVKCGKMIISNGLSREFSQVVPDT